MVKTLGVAWLPDEDVFSFKTNPTEEGLELTKRSFLKKIAKLSDPVGYLAPFLIGAKVLLQEIWAAREGSMQVELIKHCRLIIPVLDNIWSRRN